jgi:hypothetical protein
VTGTDESDGFHAAILSPLDDDRGTGRIFHATPGHIGATEKEPILRTVSEAGSA